MTPITIEDFVTAGASNLEHRYPFGLDKAATLKNLRRFIDRIESGELLAQEIELSQVASTDDFLIKSLTITFHEPLHLDPSGLARDIPPGHAADLRKLSE